MYEAVAEYYSGVFAVRVGGLDRGRFLAAFDVDRQPAGKLARPGTWADATVPYTKGVAGVGRLDAAVRAGPANGTFLDVWAALNADEEPVTGRRLRSAVAAAAGAERDGVVEQVTGRAEAVSVDRPERLLSPGRVRDGDDDGLADVVERRRGTDPAVADTDGDGLDDGREADLGTDPSERTSPVRVVVAVVAGVLADLGRTVGV